MKLDKVKKQLIEELEKLQGHGEKSKTSINEFYDKKIAKLNEERAEKLAKIKDSKDEKKSITDALIALGHKFEAAVQDKIEPEGERVPFPLDIPKEYSADLPFVRKVAFALLAVKSGTADAVKAKLLTLEPKISEKSLKTLPQTLSKLFGDNKISAVRDGKKYIYSVK